MSNSSIIPSDKLKILVVGDSGEEKTTLVHLICHGEVIKNATTTIGCNIEVKSYEYNNTKYFLEFYDICGSEKYIISRSMFYSQMSGIILVHDLTNKKSCANLKKWSREIIDATSDPKSSSGSPSNGSSSTSHRNASLYGSGGASSAASADKKNTNEPDIIFDLELNAGKMHVPVLVIGNKLDLVPKRDTSILTDMSSLNVSSIVVNTFDLKKFEYFFNCVISKKCSPVIADNSTTRARAFRRNSSDADDSTPSRIPRPISNMYSIYSDQNNHSNLNHSTNYSATIPELHQYVNVADSLTTATASLDSLY